MGKWGVDFDSVGSGPPKKIAAPEDKVGTMPTYPHHPPPPSTTPSPFFFSPYGHNKRPLTGEQEPTKL